MKNILVLWVLLLLVGCNTIPEGYISQEEADRQKHAYFCSTFEPYTVVPEEVLPWEHLPHCINGSINQQQAFTLLDWFLRMNGRLSGNFAVYVEDYYTDKNTKLRQSHPPFFLKNYEMVKRFKPYLREGDYYYFLAEAAAKGWEYYEDVEKDDDKLALWKERFNEYDKKRESLGRGSRSYWNNPAHSDEKQNELLIEEAKRGNEEAQSLLGSFYLKGKYGFEKNPAKAVIWLEQAARRVPQNLDFNSLEELRPYLSEADYRYWKIMYLMSTSKGEHSFDEFDNDLLQKLLGEVDDWKHFCDKYGKQRWLWSNDNVIPRPKDDAIAEKYIALQTIVMQCVTQYPPAEQPYINDLEAD